MFYIANGKLIDLDRVYFSHGKLFCERCEEQIKSVCVYNTVLFDLIGDYKRKEFTCREREFYREDYVFDCSCQSLIPAQLAENVALIISFLEDNRSARST